MEPYAWMPPPSVVESANVTRFVRKLGLSSPEELLSRSREDPAWFWGAVEREIDVSWFRGYTKVLDVTRGKEWARWFVDGKLNLAHDCVDKHAARRPDARAVVWEGEDGAVRTWTYGELAAQTSRLADALSRSGVRQGDAVGVFLPMIPETIAALFAIAKIGAIFVPVFSGYGADAVAKRLSDCDAKALVTADGFYRKGAKVDMKRVADEAVAACPTVRRVVVVRRLGLDVPWTAGRDVTWEEATAGARADLPATPVDSEHPWMVIYTSGTTGRPKGSVHVHGGFLVKIAQEVLHQTDLRAGDVLFWFTDMGWIMGPWEAVGCLALGGTLFLYEGAPDHPSPDRLWAMIERHRITTLGISPTLVRALRKHGDAPVRAHDLSSLRILGSTGEPWNPEPWRWFFEVVGGSRCPIINLSGGTEVGACFLSPLPTTPLRPCSLGHPALGMDVDVVDDKGNPVPRGTVGELVCRKPWPGMTRGLWKDPDRYLEAYWSKIPGLWVHGDWASIDAEGNWYLHGRSDDTIKIAGKRLGPAEVESALVDTGKVAEAAAVGIPHETKGEALWCYAVLRAGVLATDETRAELSAAVAAALGKSFRPDRILFVTQLPKTRNAKILRRAVRAAATGKDAGDLSSLENPKSLEEIRAAR